MSETIKVRVSARPEKGFYRAGRYWSSAPTDAEVSIADLVLLKAETNLVVVELGEDGEDPNSALETEKTDLTKKVSELEKKNAELERDLTGTSNGKTRVEGEKAELEKQVSALETEKTDLTKKVSELEKKNAELEARLKELEKKGK